MSTLIQRCTFRFDNARSKMDRLLALEYMGSAEFEFGAVGKSLKYLRQNKDSLIINRIYNSGLAFKSFPIEVLHIKGKEQNTIDTLDHILSGSTYTKEPVRLKEALLMSKKDKEKKHFYTDTWLDLGDDYNFDAVPPFFFMYNPILLLQETNMKAILQELTL